MGEVLRSHFENQEEKQATIEEVTNMLQTWMVENGVTFQDDAYDSVEDFIEHVSRVRKDIFLSSPVRVFDLLKDVLLQDGAYLEEKEADIDEAA